MSDFGIPMTSLLGDSAASQVAPNLPVPPPDAKDIANGAKPSAPQTSLIPELHEPTNMTDAAHQVAIFDVAGLNASVAAATKNQALLQQAQMAQEGDYNNIIAADEKLKRINSVPKGIAHVLSLFDSDWNPQNVALDIEESGIRTKQAVDRAKTGMEINNTLPELLKNMGTVTDKMFTNTSALAQHQLDVAKYGLDVQAGQRAAASLALDRIKTGIAMSEEQRKKAQFQVDSMGAEDKAGLIAKITKNPKDPARPMLGMLQESLMREQTAAAAMKSAQVAASKGDLELQQQQQKIFVDNLPTAALQGRVQDAINKHQNIVSFGNGVTVPLPMVVSSLLETQKKEDQYQATAAQQEAEDSQVGARTGRLANSAAALAPHDPRAKDSLAMINHSAGQLAANPTYENVLRHNAQLDLQQKKLDEIANNIASQFQSKDAKGAVVQFGQTGTFTREGAQAVVGDTMGNYANQNVNKYKDAWATLNNMVAIRIKQGQSAITPSAGLDANGQLNATDMMAILSANKKNPSLSAIKDEILNDPSTMTSIAGSVKTSVQKDAMIATLSSLAHSKNASPIWQNILDHNDTIISRNKDGGLQLDYNKLAEHLEQAKVLTRGKVDYPGAFATAVRAYGSTADQTSGSDPRLTLEDRALERTVFGDNPHGAIISDMAKAFAQASKKANAEMQARIQSDVSGRTQRDAITRATLPSGIVSDRFGGTLEPAPEDIDVNKIPSATGTGLTAKQITSLYGG